MDKMVFCVWVKSDKKIHELISLQFFSVLVLYASFGKVLYYNPG